MKNGYLLAIDAGTGSCRAVLFDMAGEQVAISQQEWSHRTIPEYPGSQVFDTSSNWGHLSKCIRNVIKESGISPGEILAASATSMREGIVLYDRAGREIWACPNVDSRAVEEAAELIGSGLADRIYQISGDWVSITSAARLLWIRRHLPELFARIAKLTMLSDWIVYRLTGVYVTDTSAGSSSGMFDLNRRTWSEEIVAMCGLDGKILPEVAEPGTVVGAVDERASLETGLPVGTPVVLGGADTQVGLIGIGRIHTDQFTILGGSFWQHTVNLAKPQIDPQARLRTLCHALPGQWMMEGIGFFCGLTMRWFRDAFCQTETELASRTGKDPYSLMEDLAGEAPPGANGVMGLFSNYMNAKRWIHASPSFIQFDILNPMQSGKKECIRAIEECAAYVACGHMKMIEELMGTRYREVVFAGGAAKGRLWPQILADVLGCKVNVPVVKESSALGTAVLAGIGVGVYDGLEAAARTRGANIEKIFEPDPGRHETYRSIMNAWSETYAHSLGLVEQGLAKPLWRANGT